MFTNPVRIKVRPRPYEDTGIVLAGLGLVIMFFTPVYLAFALTIVSLVTLTVPVWVQHQPRTRWSRLGFTLAIIAFVFQGYYLLTKPIS